MKKWLKMTSVLMAFLLAAMIVPVIDSEPVSAEGDNDADWVTAYQWTHVTNESQLKDGPIVLVWDIGMSSGCSYYSTMGLSSVQRFITSKVHETDWFGKELSDFVACSTELPDCFYSFGGESTLSMRVLAGEGSSELGKMIKITQRDLNVGDTPLFPQIMGDTLDDQLIIAFGGTMYEPGIRVPKNKVLIGTQYYGEVYTGRGWIINNTITFEGSRLLVQEDALDWRKYFDLYVGEQVTIHAITKDTTIKKGSVVEYSSVKLNEGVNLTVEPEATLILRGNFVNNGFIKNYGTMIVQSDAAIFSSTSKNGGYLDCIGNQKESAGAEGNLVIEKGGCVFMGTNAKACFDHGTAYVGGKLVMPKGCYLMESTMRIQEGGAIYDGYGYENLSFVEGSPFPELDNLNNVKLTPIKNPGSNTTVNPSRIIIENNGAYYTNAKQDRDKVTITMKAKGTFKNNNSQNTNYSLVKVNATDLI